MGRIQFVFSVHARAVGRAARGAAGCLLGLVAAGCLPEGPDPATPYRARAAEDGNAYQVALGAALFAQRCAGCHGAGGRGDAEEEVPALVGPDALPYLPPEGAQARALTFWTAADLFHFLRGHVRPGQLSAEEHFAILAHLLRENGVDLRGEALTLENAATLEIHP